MKKILTVTITAAVITVIFYINSMRIPAKTPVPRYTVINAEDGYAAESEAVFETETVQTKEEQSITVEEIKQLPAHSRVDVSLFEDFEIDELFYETKISEDIYERINNNSYIPNDDITLDELCYIRVLHTGFDDNTYIGELIVNEKISEDILEIMRELYDAGYPIESMILVDEYGADDDRSMAANNTSAFNYRNISGSSSDNNTSCFNYRRVAQSSGLSYHARGLAININPLYNPYVKQKGGEQIASPESGAQYADRNSDFLYKIDHDDLCYKLFKEQGFTWGGDWRRSKDYQHYEKEI